MQINYLTRLVMQSIRYNKHIEQFKQAKSVDDVKRIYKAVYFKGKTMSEGDIKGAKMINFDAIYKFTQDL